MHTRHVNAAVVLCLASFAFVNLAPCGAAELNEPPDGFTALFNGKDLTGWHGMGHVDPRNLLAMSADERAAMRAESLADVNAHWSVDSGELVNDGHGLYLTTDRDYGDIELWIDYKTVAKADSGIYLRATPQVQIWDTTEAGGKWNIGADKGSGGLWNNSPGAPGKDPLVLADRPFGEWNTFRIIQIGARTTIWLNGKLVVDNAPLENWHDKTRKTSLAPRGPIQLQTHGGEIRWRNIFVRELAPEECNRYLQAQGDEGFETVFDGLTFKGWKEPGKEPGDVTEYTIEDGALMCRKNKGSCLHTAEEYGDFVVRFEVNIPPRGNNGLAIRYPGSGDTAYRGMCELQVLGGDYGDDRLDAKGRQHHGSAYGMFPAQRGYLRPANTWNYQEVTVNGSTIRVELNGTVILDCDLSKVDEIDFMNKTGAAGHPGLSRTSGHFGFAGHGDQVKFRNVRIKRLD